MTETNYWKVLATFAQEFAPIAQQALDAVAVVSLAAIAVDDRLTEEAAKQVQSLPPSE